MAILVAVALGAVAALAFYAKHEIDDLVTPKTAAMRKAQGELKAPLPGKPTNILMLGSDHRSGDGASDKRSDTLLLVRLDPKRKTISMLSFPRDLWIDIPGHGKSKINDAYSLGGPALSVKTIKQLTGLDVNFVVDVDFKGFRGVVDAFNGIWVDVDQRYYVPPEASYMEIDLEPGYQLLDGRDALAFARHRHSDSDFHRIARQQLVLAGLKKQIAQSSKRNSIPTLFKVMKENTQIVAGGGDNVPARVIYDYMRLATSLSSKDVYQVEFKGGIGTAGEASIVTYDPVELEKAVDAFLAPSKKAREETADQLVGKQQKPAAAPADTGKDDAAAAPAAPDPATISVKVLNGSGIAGVAGSMSSKLAAIGYKVDPNPSNADNSNYASTKVLYADDSAKPAAQALADRIPGASTGPKDASNPFSTQLLVIVGRTGTDVKGDATGPVGVDDGPSGDTTAEGNAVPEKQAADVYTDPNAAADEFLEVRNTRLPIMYPTVQPNGTHYEGAYGYRFSHGKTVEDAYRLVAKMPSGIDYWGVQGTTWANPPILDDPTRTVTRKGRTYRLYFNGTKLHLIAWRQGAGTYWIANSVLDRLSNEDMLAIADGMKPLRNA
ncbi:MAG: LCP family protein [Thermoleophilia bacterium]|nr:LCP family protein [Thermoleophilia bacterium]